MPTSVTVTNTTLFHVAARALGDATQWDRIATRNSLTDPMIVGTVTLTLPIVDLASGVQTAANGR